MFRGVSGPVSALTLPSASRQAKAEEAEPADNSFTEQLFLQLQRRFQRVGIEGERHALAAHSTRQNSVTGAKLSTAPVSFSANAKANLEPNYLSEEEAKTGGIALDPVSGETRTFSVNRYAFVDRATAERLAEMLGGTLETRQVGENGGPFRGPVQYVIRVGKYAGDAAAISRRYESFPHWMAELSTRMAIARANGERTPTWNKALAQLNSGQAVFGVRLA